MKNKFINFLLPIFAISLSSCGMLRGGGFGNSNFKDSRKESDFEGSNDIENCEHAYARNVNREPNCEAKGLETVK